MVQESKSNALGWIVAVVAIALFVYVMDWGFLTGKITEYLLDCSGTTHTAVNGCFPLNPTSYYPDKEIQTVKMKTEFEIKTLTKCSIINRSNWECKFDDESATFGFLDGSFYSVSPVTIDGRIRIKERSTGRTGTIDERGFDPAKYELVLVSDSQIQYVGRVRYLLESWGIL